MRTEGETEGFYFIFPRKTYSGSNPNHFRFGPDNSWPDPSPIPLKVKELIPPQICTKLWEYVYFPDIITGNKFQICDSL